VTRSMPPSRKGIPLTEEHKRKISESHKGKIMSKESREKMRQAKLGKSPANKGISPSEETREKMSKSKIGKPMAESTREKLLESQIGKPKSEETRKKISQAHLKNHDSDSNIPKEDRRDMGYRMWRKTVYEKYDFTCQKTGVRGGRITAHHILNFSSNPEFRYNINNGIVLSLESHKEFHKIYGERNNTKEQLEEYLGRKLP